MLFRSILLAWSLLPGFVGPPPATASVTALQDDHAELDAARDDLDRARRLGDRGALAELRSWVEEEPGDVLTRALFAAALRDHGEWSEARSQAERALREASDAPPKARAACARVLVQVLWDLGEAAAADAVLSAAGEALQPGADARDAWALGRTAQLLGRRDVAREHFRAARRDDSPDWSRALARARCERALGDLVAASRSLVRADELAGSASRREPDVLAELASVYFEADGEIEHREAQRRAPGELYRAALALNKTHEGALLGLFELGRFNWNRQNTPAHEWLAQLLAAHPASIDARLASASADLDDGRLQGARATFDELRRVAPKRRELRTLEAALAWVEHRRDACEAALAELAREDAGDARPEREVARHLSELYRFAEAAPMAKRATERDPADSAAWLELGRALSNTGDEAGGLEALRKSQELAAGRQNAWRHNSIAVLDRISTQFAFEKGAGELTYAWHPDAAELLRTYWMPFYEEARAELSRRYSFTPSPVLIEVFERFQDFSVRSTGFEGFPALGVCFGPVVTSVAPHSELRGKFSWARTSFHEFTHVIHLGLSHNRCPRWITEGLATWEEENHDASWTRNMRRELLDAYANRDLILVRDLNRAFRSPRILFGYYMSGQLCRMLIEERGFAPMIRLLESFDRGADLDTAFRDVFGLTPEEVDARFAQFVRRKVEPLRIEPRWLAGSIARRKLALAESAPQAAEARQAWSDGWCAVAWGSWQSGKRVDAESALRRLALAGPLPPRATFLQAEMTLDRGDSEAARKLYESALAAGGEDYRARMVLGKLAMDEERWEEAEKQLAAAERAFPGYAEREFSAELHLAQVYEKLGKDGERLATLERWLAWSSDDFPMHLEVAKLHAAAGRHAQASKFFQGANDIDPFQRAMHVAWGRSLSALPDHEAAAREFRAALLVPDEFAGGDGDEWSDAQRAEVLALEAQELLELGRVEDAKASAKDALDLDPDCDLAVELLKRLSRGS